MLQTLLNLGFQYIGRGDLAIRASIRSNTHRNDFIGQFNLKTPTVQTFFETDNYSPIETRSKVKGARTPVKAILEPNKFYPLEFIMVGVEEKDNKDYASLSILRRVVPLVYYTIGEYVVESYPIAVKKTLLSQYVDPNTVCQYTKITVRTTHNDFSVMWTIAKQEYTYFMDLTCSEEFTIEEQVYKGLQARGTVEELFYYVEQLIHSVER